MPLYQTGEYGTDWATVLPEVGKQIANVIKTRQERPSKATQKALEMAATNPEVLNPENEAALKTALGNDYDPEGIKAARSIAGTPMFNELVQANLAKLKLPQAQIDLAKTQTRTAEISAQAEVDRVAAAREANFQAEKRYELEKWLGKEAAQRDMDFQATMKGIQLKFQESYERTQQLELMRQRGQLESQAGVELMREQMKSATDIYKQTLAEIGSFNKDLLNPNFENLKDETKAGFMSRGASLVSALVMAAGDLHKAGGGESAATRPYMMGLLRSLWLASGEDQTKFSKYYNSFINSMPAEMKQFVEDEVKAITSPPAESSTTTPSKKEGATKPSGGFLGLSSIPGYFKRKGAAIMNDFAEAETKKKQ